MGVLLAHSYILQLSDNVKRQFEQMRRNGKWTGRPRIGYRNHQELNDKSEVLSKDIVEDTYSHLVTKLFNEFSTGNYSVTTLWIKMKEEGLPGRSGKLVRSDVWQILRDPFFYGMARSKKYGLYPHNYPRLTTKEVWDKCQEVLDGRRKKRSKEQSKPYALKGLLVCKDCGCLYSPETHKEKVYYSCTNAKHVCKRVYVREDDLLKPVYTIFEKFEKAPKAAQERLVSELRMLNESEAVYHDREVARIRIDYDRSQSRIRTLLDIRLDGSITKDEYDTKLQELKDKQYRLDVEMEEHTKGDHQYHIHVATVINLSRRMGKIFKRSEPEEKHAILNFLLQNAEASGKTPTYTLKKPFQAILDLDHLTQRRG